MTHLPTGTDLPPGHVDLGPFLVHVRELRPYTRDIHRLLRHLPLLWRLHDTAPGSPERAGVLREAGDLAAFELSWREADAAYADLMGGSP